MRTIRTAFDGRIWAYVKYVTLTVFRNADTITVRLLLATASMGYALCLVVPMAVQTHVFDRHGYQIMRQFGNEWLWAGLFALHFVGVVWRIYDPRARPMWALLVNSFGFAIWALMTLSLNLAFGGVTPGTALEWTLVGASGWALYRTGMRDESVSP